MCFCILVISALLGPVAAAWDRSALIWEVTSGPGGSWLDGRDPAFVKLTSDWTFRSRSGELMQHLRIINLSG
jgi:hypothetical protein